MLMPSIISNFLEPGNVGVKTLILSVLHMYLQSSYKKTPVLPPFFVGKDEVNNNTFFNLVSYHIYRFLVYQSTLQKIMFAKHL